MDQGAIEDTPIGYVAIESFVEEMVTHTARLGDAEDVGTIDYASDRVLFVGIAEEGDGVAEPGQPETGNTWISGRVDEIVKPPGLQAFFDVEARRVRYHLAVFPAGEGQASRGTSIAGSERLGRMVRTAVGSSSETVG